MAEFPALNLYTDAFLADTSHLSATETGAYATLLFVAWRIPNGRLPADERILARLARCSWSEWKKIRETVLSFFSKDQNGTFFQKRLELEREKARAKSQKAAASANAKHMKNKETAHADAQRTHMRTQSEGTCERSATTSTSTSKEVLETPSPESAREDDEIGCALPEDLTAFTRPPSERRGGGARTAGDHLERFMVKTGMPEKRRKLPAKADGDMVRWLTTLGGMDGQQAWSLLMAARDEDDAGHTDASRQLERISRQHRLGWFAEETV